MARTAFRGTEVSRKHEGGRTRAEWTEWNVGLWIGNDEKLYNLAQACIQRAKSEGKGIRWAAALFCAMKDEAGDSHTPDGAFYSLRAVRAALTDMVEG